MSRKSSSRTDLLSRVIWPVFQTENVISSISYAYEERRVWRVCIQALNYVNVQKNLISIVRKIRKSCDVPISVSCQPLTQEGMKRLRDAGANRVSIALDAVTERLFNEVKGQAIGGPYRWKNHFTSLKEAIKIFGRNNVSTHLIAGLGEQEQEFIKMVQTCVDLDVYPAVFAFTPIPGTLMEHASSPPIDYYRRVQLGHYLITRKLSRYENMMFENGRIVDFGINKSDLLKLLRTGEPFQTSGCPGCNRPYYNERPSGPIYNYARKLTEYEVMEIEKVLCL